ncbi:type II secretion system F family protein [Methylomagnum sp.]
MDFKYRAINAQGQTVQGRLEARDQNEAARLLQQQGLTPIALDRDQPAAAARGRKKSAKAQDKALVIRELGILLRSGVPLAEAVASIGQTHGDSPIGLGFEEVNARLRSGGSLTQALREAKFGFPDYVLQLAAAGEMTGKLAEALLSAADQMDYELKISQEMRNALIYPSILVFSGVAATLLVFIVVVPKFANMLKSGRAEVPALSAWVLKIGLFVKENLFWLGLGTVGTLFALAVLLSKEEYRQKLMELLVRLPIIGDWLIQTETGRWASMFGTLLENRVPIVNAMELAYGGVRINSLKHQFQQALRDLRGGRKLGDALATTRVLSLTGLNLIRVGERSGELAPMLRTLAMLHENAGRERLKRFLILLEPMAILLIGGVLGTIMIAIMMAITSISTIAI